MEVLERLRVFYASRNRGPSFVFLDVDLAAFCLADQSLVGRAQGHSKLYRLPTKNCPGLFVIGGAWFGTLLIRIDLGYLGLIWFSFNQVQNKCWKECFTLPGGVSGHIETISSSLIQIFEKMVILQVCGSKLEDGVHVVNDWVNVVSNGGGDEVADDNGVFSNSSRSATNMKKKLNPSYY
ncbi:hypothetical protein Tco_0179318 [Tanacetum coccineum]